MEFKIVIIQLSFLKKKTMVQKVDGYLYAIITFTLFSIYCNSKEPYFKTNKVLPITIITF